MSRIDGFGSRHYYLNNLSNIEDAEMFNGNKFWWSNNKRHREDGPAIEWDDGSKEWFLNGLRHREDGPAVEWTNGYKEYHYHGNLIDCKDLKEFLKMIKLMAFL